MRMTRGVGIFFNFGSWYLLRVHAYRLVKDGDEIVGNTNARSHTQTHTDFVRDCDKKMRRGDGCPSRSFSSASSAFDAYVYANMQ